MSRIIAGLTVALTGQSRRNLIRFTGMAAFRLTAVALGIVYVKVYATLLMPTELAAFFYLSTLSYLITAFLFVPFDYYLQARLAEVGAAIPIAPMLRLILVILGFGGICALAIGLPLTLLGELRVTDMFGIYLMAAILFGCTTGRNLLNNRGHQLFVISMLTFESFARTVTLLIANIWFAPTARQLFYTSVAALAVELIMILGFAARRLTFDATVPTPFASVRRIAAEALPIALSAGCNIIQLQSFRLLFVWMGVPATAALYAVVANLGSSAMSAIGAVYSQFRLPLIYQSNGKFAHRYVREALLIGAVVGVLVLLASEPLVRLLTTEAFVGNSLAIGFGVAVDCGNLAITGATVFLVMRRRTSRLVACNLIAAAVALAGQFAVIGFAPENPYLVGVPIVVSQAIVVVFLLRTLNRERANDRAAMLSNPPATSGELLADVKGP